MKNKVILVSGNLKSGKSTISAMLIDFFLNENKTFKIYSFASKIKEIAKNHFGWDGKKDPKGRKLLQTLGTEVGRAYNENIWVDYFYKLLKNNPETVFIVDDWRFVNEYTFIKDEADIFKVRVINKFENLSPLEKIMNLFRKKHSSESSLPTNPDFYDFVFVNKYSSLDELGNSEQMKILADKINTFLGE